MGNAPTAWASEEPTQTVQHRKYLLLDRRIVERTKNVDLVVGKVKKHPRNPLFGEDKPWEVRFDNLYPNVIWDDGEQIFKCWYSPFVIDAAYKTTPPSERKTTSYAAVRRALRKQGKGQREMGVCYATSRDGINWTKPLMDIHPWEGRKSNLVLVGPHGAGILKDSREADPQRRYKMFMAEKCVSVAFSPDGLHWSEPVPCPQIEARADTHNNAFWAPELRKYVGITRNWAGQRIVARTESDDFLHWTRATEVLRGTVERQTYAMLAFRHADVYLGLLMILDASTDRVHCELAWSPNTRDWERIDPGTPLIANGGKPRDYDWGTVYAAAPVVLDHEVRIYYGAGNGTHSNWRDGFLALATLRPDGFASVTAPLAGGEITTKPLRFSGNRLAINYSTSAAGSVRVEIQDAEGRPIPGFTLEDCPEIIGDQIERTVSWKQGPDLGLLAGKPIRLRFVLKDADLYALRFQ